MSFKRPGFNTGDADADTLDALAQLAEQFSAAEARLTHEQNLLLPWVHESDLPALYEAARALGLAQPNIGLLTDMIICPGGDFCSLANARSLHIGAAVTERYRDLDELFDLGPIDLHMSGCINSCGHHHSGHIGILGVDKDGGGGTRSRWAAPTARRCRARRLAARWWAILHRRRSAGRDRSPARHLPPRTAQARRILYRRLAPHRPRPIQAGSQRAPS